MPYRIAYFVSHPIQYQAPLLRFLAAQPDLELTVFFYSDFSLRAYEDAGFGQKVQWDIPLTEGYHHQFLKCWGSKQPNRAWKQAIALDIPRQLKMGKFDIVWIHGWSQICGLQALLAARKHQIPILLRGDSNVLQDTTQPLKRYLKTKILHWLFQQVDGFLCVGTRNLQFYQQYGVPNDRLFLMPYAVDNQYFQQQANQASLQRDTLRHSLHLDPDRPIILYTARLAPEKRPQDLLAAYQHLSTTGAEPIPYLLLVGDGPLRSELEAIARSTGWNSIHFLGFRNQSELPQLYNLCDVFVLPSQIEPWGLVVNEVMNAAKPVIVSDRVGAAIDLVEPDHNGYIFPVGDIAALVHCLKQALDPKVNTQMGQASLERIQSWDLVADYQALRQAIERVVEHKREQSRHDPNPAERSPQN